MKHRGNCWPTELQTLLLSAALCEKTQAEKAWKEYVLRADLKKVEDVSICIFPLVYRNMQRSTIAPEALAICKSKYRYIWIENQMRFHFLSKVLDQFSQAGISACLLKGAALIASCYHDIGIRVMGDVDILVDQAQFWDAIAILKSTGWQLKIVEGGTVLTPEKPLNFHAAHFTNAAGDEIDLHWRFSPWAIIDASMASLQLKQCEIKSDLLKQTISVLIPEDQLLHTIIHGLRYSQEPLIRWVHDAAYLIAHTEHFDWDYFFEQIAKGDLFFMAQQALLYLHEKNFVVLPETTHLRLHAHKASAQEKLYFQCNAISNESFLSRFRIEWYQHVRNSDSRSMLKNFFAFPEFLMKKWNANNIVSLFFIICYRWFFRIARRLC